MWSFLSCARGVASDRRPGGAPQGAGRCACAVDPTAPGSAAQLLGVMSQRWIGQLLPSAVLSMSGSQSPGSLLPSCEGPRA